METIWIELNTIRKLKQFVADCSTLDLELEVASGEHTANAKSLLGLMTLTLSGPLALHFQVDPVKREQLMKTLEPYRIYNLC